MSEFTNAVLTQIATPGPLSDNGDPGTPVQVWSGRAAGYLKRTRKSVLSNGAQVRVVLDVFWILDSELAPVIEVAGADWEASSVVIEDQRTATPVQRRFTVSSMEHRAAGTEVDSVRMELEGEKTP
jgi:hypothetical protein